MGNNQLNTGVKKGENNTPGIMSLVISIIAVIGCWIPGLNIISMFLAVISGIIAVISLISAFRNKSGSKSLPISSIIISLFSIFFGSSMNNYMFNSSSSSTSSTSSSSNTSSTSESSDSESSENTESNQNEEKNLNNSEGKSDTNSETSNASNEEKKALKKAEFYSSTAHMSKKGIYEQLTSEYGENFTKEAAQYAIDNIEADWNLNALEKAKNYQSTANMSKKAIYEQLISDYGEKFTKSEAQYAIDHLDN